MKLVVEKGFLISLLLSCILWKRTNSQSLKYPIISKDQCASYFSHIHAFCYLTARPQYEKRYKFCLLLDPENPCSQGMQEISLDIGSVCCTTDEYYNYLPLRYGTYPLEISEQRKIFLASVYTCDFDQSSLLMVGRLGQETKNRNYPICLFFSELNLEQNSTGRSEKIAKEYQEIDLQSKYPFCIEMIDEKQLCPNGMNLNTYGGIDKKIKAVYCCKKTSQIGFMKLKSNNENIVSVLVPKHVECPIFEKNSNISSATSKENIEILSRTKNTYFKNPDDLFSISFKDTKIKANIKKCIYTKMNKSLFHYLIRKNDRKRRYSISIYLSDVEKNLGGACGAYYPGDKCLNVVSNACCIGEHVDRELDPVDEFKILNEFYLPKPERRRCQRFVGFKFFMEEGFCHYVKLENLKAEEIMKYPTFSDNKERVCYLSTEQCQDNFEEKLNIEILSLGIICCTRKDVKITNVPVVLKNQKLRIASIRSENSFRCPSFKGLTRKDTHFIPIIANLDHDEDIRAIIESEETNTNIVICDYTLVISRMPKNSYKIPYQKGYKCPEGFNLERISQDNLSILTDRSEDYVCIMKNSAMDEKEDLFKGTFCVGSVSFSCPKGTELKNLTYCCKSSTISTIINPPNIEYFSLYGNKKCSDAIGFNVIQIPHRDSDMFICHYMKNEKDMNGTMSKRENYWPPGEYGLLKTRDTKAECPEEFRLKEESFSFDKFRLEFQGTPNYFFKSDYPKQMSYHICLRLQIYGMEKTLDWPSGVYCVIRIKHCPQNLKEKKLGYFNLCCHEGENQVEELLLPDVEEFILFVPSEHKCPKSYYMQMHQSKMVYKRGNIVEKMYICYYHHVDSQLELSNRSWPNGKYLLPVPDKYKPNYYNETHTAFAFGDNPEDGNWPTLISCPDGFNETVHIYETSDKKRRASMRFCEKDYLSVENSNQTEVWPKGDYCFMKLINEPCSTNQNLMVVGTISPYELKLVSKITRRRHSGNWFEETDTKPLSYKVCCAMESRYFTELPLFNNGKYWFLRNPNNMKCSRVSNTHVKLQDIPSSMKIFRSSIGTELKICEYMHLNEETSDRFFKISIWDISTCQCTFNAQCDLENDDTTCKCKEGFFGDGHKKCHEVKIDTDDCANMCSENANCTTDDKKIPRCECKEGYAGDGFTCIKSCENITCNELQVCRALNPNDPPVCVCKPGYIGTGGSKCNPSLAQATLDNNIEILFEKSSCLDDFYANDIKQKDSKFYYIFLMDDTQIDTLGSCEAFRRRITVLPESPKLEKIIGKNYSDNYEINLKSTAHTRYKILLKDRNIYVNGLSGKLNFYTNALIIKIKNVVQFDEPFPLWGLIGSLISIVIFLLIVILITKPNLRRNYMFNKNLFDYNTDQEILCSGE